MPTRATRRIVAGIVIGMLGGAGAPAAGRAAAPCEALVGKWKWFTGGVVSINPDGTIAHDPGNEGTWECTDAARGRVTLRWRLGGYVNRLALSGDGRALASTDPSQSYVTAQRIGPPRTVEVSPPARPAEAPRRAETPPPAKPPQTAKGTEPQTSPPKAADPRPVDPKATGPTTPNPKPFEPKVVTPPASTAPPEPGRPGTCSGNACMRVDVETIDRCVWLRSSAEDVVQAEVRLAGETVKMTLEKPDLAKVVKEAPRGSATARQAAARRRLDELRRQGHNIPYDPKVEGLRDASAPGPTGDRSRAWHGTKYDPVWMKDRPVFHARIDRAGGCVTDPGQILSYRVTSASGGGKEAESAPPVIACEGEACGDLDLEQVGSCQLINRGRRQIVVGLFRKGNDHATVNSTLEPGKTLHLVSIACMRAEEIGKVEARYK
jgi:hypothetical protein